MSEYIVVCAQPERIHHFLSGDGSKRHLPVSETGSGVALAAAAAGPPRHQKERANEGGENIDKS